VYIKKTVIHNCPKLLPNPVLSLRVAGMLIVFLSQENASFCTRNLHYLEELRWGIPHADGNLLELVGEWRQTKVRHRKHLKTKVRGN